MAAQWEPPRRPGTPSGGPAQQQARPGENTAIVPLGRPYGRPVTPVEFFRRMPTGGGTVYFKPSQD
ncbi:hypothetical protein FHX82_000451 [Amycolatopsis bartoniae]|uniref:Uncharacterized protein n=1 Tax=Amycolatopsis bartoniae TaxID=941986 RepID=A0A8H9J0K8_9PSEU|nr:hypothetical protein [Amycolatopsis bartoniae]MBB2933431.1 hypothetical protein [Amycolatopsis bartoniae]TVT06606.1 hypothetical protein FNH07_19290 [Amycolatopsis bartoniae]GHF59396.1 hypothetical protein GCM10017566_36170 [Amycolatopsis bartoniae]